ncbi:MAG: macro domain-containing protein [Myxococcota bacterium]
MSRPRVSVVVGDLLDQDVDAIVNAWNRNVLPWWLLIPQGVSRSIRRRAGLEPFRELRGKGVIPLGGAVVTGPGRLLTKGIIHVAGINLLWRSSESSIRQSVRSALRAASEHEFRSIALPLVGAGTGGGNEERVEAWILDELHHMDSDARVVVVRYPGPNAGLPGRSAKGSVEREGAELPSVTRAPI